MNRRADVTDWLRRQALVSDALDAGAEGDVYDPRDGALIGHIDPGATALSMFAPPPSPTPRPPQRSAERRQELAVAFHRQGYSTREIADALEVSNTQIAEDLKRSRRR